MVNLLSDLQLDLAIYEYSEHFMSLKEVKNCQMR